MTATLVDASGVARILGTSRQRIARLVASQVVFPPGVIDAGGRRRWDRVAIERWAAHQPDLPWGWSPPELSEPGHFTARTQQIMAIAGKEANALNHDFIGDVHVLLALLYTDCPGAARNALESCGLGLDEARRSVIEKLGSPDTPSRHGQLLDRETSIVLEQATRKAIELRDEEVSSEHVLLALADRGKRCPAGRLLARHGMDCGEVAERVLALTESDSGTAHRRLADAVAEHQLDAAEVAGVLGVTRATVSELAGSPDFPRSEISEVGHRRWPRRAVIEWGAAHPQRGPLRAPLESPAAGAMPARLAEIFALASSEAERLNHSWLGPDHLLLALLAPECPGLARDALEAFGVTSEEIRKAWEQSMGDPFEPTDRPLAVPPATHHVLERARLHAAELQDDEVASEHVLLALTDAWLRSAIARLIKERGGDAASVRRRLISLTDGMLPAPKPPPPQTWPELSPKRIPRPPEPELAPSPLGHDPRRRRPWGSGVFSTDEGKTFKQGIALRQYRIDRDGYPILTTDGQPIHSLIDEEGRDILDEDGNPINAVLDVPPGAHMRAYPTAEE